MKNNYIVHAFESSTVLVEELSARICEDLQKALTQKGSAVLAVSGGTTPKSLFEKLSTKNLPWSKVTITLVDERWVNPQNSSSNEKLVRETLLQNRARQAKFIPLKNAVSSSKDALVLTKSRFKNIDTLDVVLLGMGEDGHTASFFPNTAELQEALTTDEKCCATLAPTSPLERMTLSRSFLLSATTLILHIEGERKKNIFEIAAKSSDAKSLPILSMMQQEMPLLEVYYA